MDIPTSTDVLLPTATERGESPLLPRHLLDLFGRPAKFFTDRLALGHTPYLLFVTWCFGVANAIDRLEVNIMRAEFGTPRPGWDRVAPLIAESWIGFWIYLVVAGALSAVGVWFIGGWWYRVRLRWAGAPDPDARLARLVYVYSAFVSALPALISAVVSTAIFPNYRAAYDSEELYSLALLVFPFWAIVVSYKAVRAVFGIGGWRVVLWFLVLPAIVFVFVLGLIAMLFALAGGLD